MKASEFDKRFDAGEDMENEINWSKAHRPNLRRLHPPIHPGEVLREEFLKPFGLKPYTLAKRLNVQRSRIERIAAEKQPITPDTALRLARFFGNSPEFWMNLQATYDVAVVLAERGAEIETIEPLRHS